MHPEKFQPAPRKRLAVLCSLCLVIAACGSKGGDAGSQVVATVNKSEISVHQVNQVLQRLPAATPGSASASAAGTERQVLDRIIEQEIAVQRALEMKLDRDPEVMQNIAAARRDALARAYGAKVAATATRPQEQDVQDYFDARPALFAQRKVYALQEFAVQANKDQADALGQFVAKAKSLAEVTDYLRALQLAVRANQSTQPAENLPPALLQRLSAMKDGQLLLLAAPGGARIIVLAGTRPAPVTLAQARNSIEQALTSDRQRLAVQTDLDAARKASEIHYFGQFAKAVSAASTAAASTAVASTAVASTSVASTSAASTLAAVPGATSTAANPATAAAASASTATAAAPQSAAAIASDESAAMLSKGLAGLK